MGLKKFLNSFELKALEIIRPIEVAHGCRFHAKVKLGDVLEIRGSGLEDDHFHYASRAHFDFIVVQDNRVCFAIELDGPGHYRSHTTPERDKKKNYICRHFDFELLRIDLGYLNEVRDSHVLPILLQNHLIRNYSKQSRKHKSASQRLTNAWNENQSSAARYSLEQHAQVYETIGIYSTETTRTFERNENDFVYVAKVLQVGENRYCVGQSSAHPSKIFGMNQRKLAESLATIELRRKVSQYEQGVQPGKSFRQVELIRSVYAAPKKFPDIRKLVLESY